MGDKQCGSAHYALLVIPNSNRDMFFNIDPIGNMMKEEKITYFAQRVNEGELQDSCM